MDFRNRSHLRTSARLGVLQLGIVAGLGGLAMADPPTLPTTAPASSSAETQALTNPTMNREINPAINRAINTALVRLSDRDPAVRDGAREELMGLSSVDLDSLRSAVQQLRPLSPGVASALHEIVTHVYLAGENNDGDPMLGFMGVLMDPYRWVHADDEGESELPLGVVVELRLPGFAAHRVLRDGDIILAISTGGPTLIPVHSSQDVMDPVSKLKAGQQVRLQIIRHGRRIEKTLTLDARPRELERTQAALTFDSFRKMQDQKAEDFWSAHFAQVVGDSIS